MNEAVRTPDDVAAVLRQYDEANPAPSHYDRRMREREAEEAAKTARAKEVKAAQQNAQQWSAWAANVNQGLANARQRLSQIDAMILPAECRSVGDDRPAGLVRIISETLGKLHKKLQAGEAKQAQMEQRLAAMSQRLIAAEKRALSAGRMPRVKTWVKDGVAFENDLFSHHGSLWQAKQTTGQTPGGSLWRCVARAGRDAPSVTPRGEHDPSDSYSPLDIVTRNGHAYICTRADPGVPSQCDDWMLLASRGAAGPRGHKGVRGDKGEKGDAARAIASWEIDREKFVAVPFLSDGTAGPALHLRKFFEAYRDMTSE